jgi:hypothetical protein
MAGIYARNDREEGVWRAPAGIGQPIAGTVGLAVRMSDSENGLINPLGLNALRIFPDRGTVPWGARTLQGAESLGSDWKYIPVRRLALHVEESLERGLAWVVFEPDGELLWATIRQQAGAFLMDLWRRGGLAGGSARDAYFVKCDSTTAAEADIEAGIVNVVVGYAAQRPAEFIVFNLQLKTAPPGA